jgi:hypothetical protein
MLKMEINLIKIRTMYSKYNRYLHKIPNNFKTIGLVIIPSILYLIRGWQYIRTPQLYAEDGALWLADAYNKGWRTLFSPYNGFAHTTERLFALLVIMFPLKFAPLIFNLAGYGLFILMCYYLFSSRVKIFTNNFQKLFMALSLGLIANFIEFIFNFSTSIFLIGVIGLCIYFAKPANNTVIRLVEKILFILACLTLPFAWFYLVIILFDWIWRKQYKIFYIVVSIFGSIVQLYVYLFSDYSRTNSVHTRILLTSKYTVLEIFNQIITPALRFAQINIGVNIPLYQFLIIFIFCVLLGLVLLSVLIKHGTIQLKYLVLFSVLFTMAALKNPLVGGNLNSVNILKLMDTTELGNRYFFYGILGVTAVLAIAASTYINKKARIYFLLLYISFGLLTSVVAGELIINKNFSNYSASYINGIKNLNRTKQGTLITIPENPGTTWFIKLYAKK